MGIAFLIRHPSTSRPSGGGNVAPPPATLRCCTNRKPKPRSISPLPDTQRNGDLFATDATNEHAPINIQWLHPPTTPPLPPHCQEQGNPSNFRSIHWLRLTATVSFPKSRFHYKTFFTCFKQRSPSSTDIRNLPADRFRTEKNKRLKT